MVKVHVVLRDLVRKNPEAKQSVLARVIRESGMQGVNENRFQRYGIITGDIGDIEENRIPALRELPEVDSVEQDSVKYAM